MGPHLHGGAGGRGDRRLPSAAGAGPLRSAARRSTSPLGGAGGLRGCCRPGRCLKNRPQRLTGDGASTAQRGTGFAFMFPRSTCGSYGANGPLTAGDLLPYFCQAAQARIQAAGRRSSAGQLGRKYRWAGRGRARGRGKGRGKGVVVGGTGRTRSEVTKATCEPKSSRRGSGSWNFDPALGCGFFCLCSSAVLFHRLDCPCFFAHTLLRNAAVHLISTDENYVVGEKDQDTCP